MKNMIGDGRFQRFVLRHQGDIPIINPGLGWNQSVLEENLEVIQRIFTFFASENDPLRFQMNSARGFLYLCLSEIDDNILMWSHYANDHQGVVLKLRQNLSAGGWANSGGLGTIPRPMNYSTQRYSIDYRYLFEPESTPEFVESFSNLVHSKSTDWAYEKEWRMMYSITDPRFSGEGVKTVSFAPEDLEEIVIGNRFRFLQTQRLKDFVQKVYPVLLKFPKLLVYRMLLDSTAFGLKKVGPLEPDELFLQITKEHVYAHLPSFIDPLPKQGEEQAAFVEGKGKELFKKWTSSSN
ncbi:MAG: DUF2971 domain-containing protein [Verrucomicrobiales bacterium]|nr:DUF2971 domain-containing protein [Verrucomicrobiales bacterium]